MVVVNSIVFKMLVLKISEEATIERIQNRVPNTSQHTIPLKLFFNISQHLSTPPDTNSDFVGRDSGPYFGLLSLVHR